MRLNKLADKFFAFSRTRGIIGLGYVAGGWWLAAGGWWLEAGG